MNDIKAIDGKLYLMPEGKEISIDSAMGVMALIRVAKDHLSYLQKELEGEQKALAKYEVLANEGIDTAFGSAELFRKKIADSERAIYKTKSDLKSYEFSLEIAREKEKRTMLAEELARLISDKETLKQTEVKPPLSLPQIALIHLYNGEQITREQGKIIAFREGYISKTSGDKLYQHFTRLSSQMNRKGDAENERINRNKMNLIESIIHLLHPTKQQRAKDEVEALKRIIETH